MRRTASSGPGIGAKPQVQQVVYTIWDIRDSRNGLLPGWVENLNIDETTQILRH
jgi:hypothetical protein